PILKNKAFFFFNYEEERRPAKGTLQRVVLTPDAANGTFSYNTAAGVRQVNLLQLAAANGQLATLDPTIAKVLGDIRSATGTTGSLSGLSNPLVQQYTFQTPTNNFNPAPTFRLDYDVSQNHRLTGSMNYRHINSTPDTTNNAQVPFPGFPQTGSQQSTRWTTSESLRSTLGSHLVNEARFGGTGGATLFSPELNASLWQGTGLGQTNGYRLDLFNACCGAGFRLTNPNTGNTSTNGGGANGQSREASTWVAEDTATFIRGKHSVTFGGSMVQADVWIKQQTIVPTATFGVLATESASQMFTGANFPGASQADITQAQNLYAMLTGRINSLTGTARINPDGSEYVPLGESTAQGRMRELDFYAADQWRASTNLTVSAGVRYVLSLPFYPTNNSYTTVTPDSLCGISGRGTVAGCNLFQPGAVTGARPNYVQYPSGTYAYNVDRNNIAPSIGLAYQMPGMSGGVGRAIFGAVDGDSVVRGGFALAYQRPGMSDFTGVFGNNQGILQTLQRDNTNSTLPILLRTTPTLPAAPSVSYPIATNSLTNILNAFDANLQIPYTQSYTIGWQRKLGRDTALEIRYVGSRHRQDWETIDLNEPNIAGNGFANEFRRAQANLQANIAAGRGATFAYTGAPGTSPLPIFLAYAEPEPVRVHVQQRHGLHGGDDSQRPARQHDVPRERRRGGAAGQLLRRQPGRARRRALDDQRRRHALRLDAVRGAQALHRRRAVHGELCVGPRVHLAALRAAEADGGHSAERSGRRRRARVQDQLDLPAAVRARAEVGEHGERAEGGLRRRLVDRRHRAHPDRRDARLRQ
ncbi:MAG: hypothetical protein DMF93_24410, partial [Acidobacteria bacterium]